MRGLDDYVTAAGLQQPFAVVVQVLARGGRVSGGPGKTWWGQVEGGEVRGMRRG